MRRGVISLPAEITAVEESKQFVFDNVLTPLELNFFALYWDELIIPDDYNISIGIMGEDDYIRSGFLKRPVVHHEDKWYESFEISSLYSIAQTYILDKMRCEDKDCDWRLNVMGESFHLADGEMKNAFRLELTNVLPVPDESVNIQDILEFKYVRNAELLAFNNYLDELYLEVVSSGDFNLSRAKAFSKLRKALQDLNKLNSEGWRSPIKFDTSALFEANNGDLMSGASALYSILEANQGNLTGAITAGVAAVIGQGFARLKPCIQSVRRKPSDTIAYLSSAHKESILKKS
ncbi:MULTISPECIES: DUF6236 family protein [Klebsiella]|uniref:DUF6236 family protein n=1 Tax=Klebsiella TaxID=570 RepID=UPI00224781DF|nr:DUF6236 family protein [Klebsiella grimontii]MCW9473447.1 DUF6236 family protein [Klebsiella grimontii]